MDPFTHTFAGGLMASGGLRKLTPLATAALLIGANAPDIDIVTSWMGEYASLAYRRGWTHGVLAWLVLPLAITAVLMIWQRVRRHYQGKENHARVQFWPLLLVSMLAVLSHPFLDWLNNYGIRLLMPFDNTWFYGDTLFVLDPWVWLVMGGAWFLIASERRWQQLLWGLFWLGSSALVSLNSFSTTTIIVLWYLGLAVIIGLRLRNRAYSPTKTARWALAIALLYIAANGIAGRMAVNQVQQAVVADGNAVPVDIMVAPFPANPLKGSIVLVYEDHYQLGEWNWTAEYPVTLDQRVPANRYSPVVKAAAKSPGAKQFLRWSRYPYASLEARDGGGYWVSFKDARYTRQGDMLRGPTVELGPQLNVVQEYIDKPDKSENQH